MADDGYTARHQDRLWALLPAIYRTVDLPDGAGPLHEIVDRIGGEFANLRRGIDRLWDNQSIETCDDWVIPYIGDLLATRLVSCLDARAQRLDVAKTIYYRRRSGTLGLLEELAADIAGHDARAVEFFRRLGRTRHQFDPAIGPVPTYHPGDAPGSAVIEGLAGATSGTPAGGYADLRNNYPARNSAGAFDEYAHTADLRRGVQSAGWHNIPHLGVFIWWLYAFPIRAATPVSNGATPPCFSFDPSGRRIPLFARSSRIDDLRITGFGEDWISPDEWNLPVRVRETLWCAYPDELYPVSFAVDLTGGPTPAPRPRGDVRIHPETGVFSFVDPADTTSPVVDYHFGFSARIGAGGFDERVLSIIDQPPISASVTGGSGLDAALAAIAGTETVEIADSLTYPGIAAALVLPVPPAAPAPAVVMVRAHNQKRPVIRWAGGGASWIITGQGGSLVLQGVWLQGADIVLRGVFDTVHLRLMTLDPGTQGRSGAPFDTAIDGMALAPVTLWIEGEVQDLVLERSITGPIRARGNGFVERLSASDSIIQSIAVPPAPSAAPSLAPSLVPVVPAIEGTSGEVSLARCTVLGPIAVHRLSATECIMDDVATVEDTQHGCVRFSAYADGSVLHAPYRSVRVPPHGPLFRSRRFGDPDYARLYRLADHAIIAPADGDSILGGAENESEMGAFKTENIPLRKRGLAAKYEEYAPLGIYPVWIDAD
ncbi:hypothetical protein [Novosphingobium lentum]|uniref:hypothetical protein n=1 Tax=Novosphingobium lentum TaxID=145287 RepID=UPI00082ACFC8|nr:hypothetical protein [Novosphingobium lentum]